MEIAKARCRKVIKLSDDKPQPVEETKDRRKNRTQY